MQRLRLPDLVRHLFQNSSVCMSALLHAKAQTMRASYRGAGWDWN